MRETFNKVRDGSENVRETRNQEVRITGKRKKRQTEQVEGIGKDVLAWCRS